MMSDLFADPLLRYVLVMLWLLPCAIQDRRTRRVSNWLTIPLFLAAWPASLLLKTSLLTFATFAGFWLAFQLEKGSMGGADGKIATGLAAFAPLALLASIAINGLAFLILRLRGKTNVQLPGAVGFYLGVVSSFLVLVLQAWVAQRLVAL